jgi:hypothetical protein
MTCEHCGKSPVCVQPREDYDQECLCCRCAGVYSECETCYDGPDDDEWTGRGIHEVYADAWRGRP